MLLFCQRNTNGWKHEKILNLTAIKKTRIKTSMKSLFGLHGLKLVLERKKKKGNTQVGKDLGRCVPTDGRQVHSCNLFEGRSFWFSNSNSRCPSQKNSQAHVKQPAACSRKKLEITQKSSYGYLPPSLLIATAAAAAAVVELLTVMLMLFSR